MSDFVEVLRSKKFLVLDTETTGLHRAEIVQIAIINHAGETLLDTLVKPLKRIPREVIAIHGITNQMVTNSPAWAEVAPQAAALLEGNHVVVYNASFDQRMLRDSSKVAKVDHIDWDKLAQWHCAMRAYAYFWQSQSKSYRSPRWQGLSNACVQQGIVLTGAHNALHDCQATLGLVKKMLGAQTESGQ